MRHNVRTSEALTQRFWLRFLILVPLAVVMIVGSRDHIRTVCATYDAWTPAGIDDADFTRFDMDDVHLTRSGVVEVVEVSYGADGEACVTFRALDEGVTGATFGDEGLSFYWDLEVRDGAVLCGGVDFTGWEDILICVCAFLAVAAALCASVLIQLQCLHWFGYRMVASCGGMLFLFFQFVLFTTLLAQGNLRGFSDLAFEITKAADYFVLAALVPMGVLAVLVSISNIALMRHEGARPVNLLGIAVSVLWIAATLLWLRWWYVGPALSLPVVVTEVAGSAIAVALSYGECLLVATVLCAWIASREVPDAPVDYLVVLGCGIRKDGTPSPLLAGRVDRALEFDAACVAAGAAPATFVPSGGQGPDEVISEARSMGDYLVGRGVDPGCIVLEERSATTRENMAFSREVIERAAGFDVGEVSVGFSTTNYHVFRGYVCAHAAGMAVRGMGSKTRAYFWPNAFLREFAGLLTARWKGILTCYVAIAALYVIAEYTLLLV